MNQSPTIGALAAALVAAQNDIQPVFKDSTNPDFRSKYASLDTIIETIRPILAAHQLAIVQGASGLSTDGKALQVETTLIHSSGEWLSTTVFMPLVGRMLKGGGRAEPDPQAGGSAVTYGRRYGLAALLCLATDEDDDGNAASRAPQRKQSAAGKASIPPHAMSTGSEQPPNAAAPRADVPRIDARTHMPIGKDKKGQPYSAFSREELHSAAAWCDEHGKTEYAKYIRAELTNRVLAPA